MAKKYRVVLDQQGGEFGMGRDFTALEWLEQAVEWRDADDSWGDYGNEKQLDHRAWFIRYWKRMIRQGKEADLINYIADIWSLVFEEISDDNETKGGE